MPLEVGTHIYQLDVANPVGLTDPKSQGDDHIRLLKTALKTDLPNITAPITATQDQINNAALGASLGLHNLVHNGNFSINQRNYVSGTLLATGAYAHDRWKAGAGGCTYTYSTTNNVTTINIVSGTLIHVIGGNDLQSGPVILSWVGTSTGSINGGAFGASGVTGTAVGGTNLSVEFGSGTLTKVQLEAGSSVTSFESRPYLVEELLCMEICEIIPVGNVDRIWSNAVAAQNNTMDIPLKVRKRFTPGISAGWTTTNCSSPSAYTLTKDIIAVLTVNTAAGQIRLVNSTPIIITCDY